MINRKRMLEEFMEMVQIPCRSKQERQVADYLKQKLTDLGAQVSEDAVYECIGGNSGNIFGFLPGTIPGAPAILLSAHMDGVDPCENIKPVLRDGIITSEGETILGGDDKAGVESILEGLRVVKEQKLAHGDIQVLFTVCEEAGLRGSKEIDRSMLRGEMGFVLDSSGSPGLIITKAPGQNQLAITVQGKTAHAGVVPEEGINAIVVAAKCLAAVPDGRLDEETTANVGIIQGGKATNIVPDRVEIQAEVRSRNADKLAAKTEEIKEIYRQTAAACGGSANVLVYKAYEPYVLQETDPPVALAVRACKAAGLATELRGSGGGSDANHFNGYGLPSVVLGVGMSKVHTTEEFLKEEDLYTTGRLVVEIIRQTTVK